MSGRDDRGMPRTARAKLVIQEAGPKPKNRDCLFEQADGTVDWPSTERDFPIRRKGDR